jgi:hypothetical protein
MIENHPFKITEYDRFVTVTWPAFHDIRDKMTKVKLVEAAFQQSKAVEVGFVLELNNKEYDIMWINSFLSLTQNDYVHYVQDMYVIRGVAYRDKQDAEKLYNWLEGKYIWQLLKD